MTPLESLRDVGLDDVVVATPVLASALCILLVSVLLAIGFVVALLLPLAVLAAFNPTVSFGVPPTQYPSAWLGVQAVWTALFGLGVVALARAARRTSALDAIAAPSEPVHAPTREEHFARLVEAVGADEGN